MGGKEIRLRKGSHIAEHCAVFHMVAVHKRVGVGQPGGAAAVEKDRAGQRKRPRDIAVDVIHIRGPLHKGVVDIRAVNGQPAADIGVAGLQLGQGGVVRRQHGGLVVQQLRPRKGPAADGSVLPEGKPAEGEQHQHKQPRRRADGRAARTGQPGRRPQHQRPRRRLRKNTAPLPAASASMAP